MTVALNNPGIRRFICSFISSFSQQDNIPYTPRRTPQMSAGLHVSTFFLISPSSGRQQTLRREQWKVLFPRGNVVFPRHIAKLEGPDSMTGNPDVAASWVSGGDPVLKMSACHHSGRNVNTALSLPQRRSPSLFTFLAIPQVTQGRTRDAGFTAGHARHVLAAPEGLKQRPFGLILHFFACRLPSYSRGNVTGELENVCAESADGDSCCQRVCRDRLFTMPDGC